MRKTIIMLATALLFAGSVEAQNVRKAKKQMEKQEKIEDMKLQQEINRANREAQLNAAKTREVDVQIPCMEFQNPPAGIIRSNVTEGIGESFDMTTAGKMARQYAVASLASKISISVANTSRGMLKENAVNDMRVNEKVFVDALKNTVMQEIQGYRTVCEKFTQGNGIYKCYVVVEIDKNDLQNVFNRLSNDGIIRTDYHFEKFQKDLEEDIKKFEERNK